MLQGYFSPMFEFRGLMWQADVEPIGAIHFHGWCMLDHVVTTWYVGPQICAPRTSHKYGAFQHWGSPKWMVYNGKILLRWFFLRVPLF